MLQVIFTFELEEQKLLHGRKMECNYNTMAVILGFTLEMVELLQATNISCLMELIFLGEEQIHH